ncbi:MAG: hypothetical protein IT518_02455, partial [Burkholderiales bacterium]|nr:hypothetical protein [Burkholderiales bacterium]
QRRLADDSGIAGSTTRHVYPFPLARWLAHAFARETEVDWRNVADPVALDGVIRPLLAWSEREAFDSGEIGTREFVALARPAQAVSDLQWLTAVEPGVEDAWDAAEPPIAWQLGECRGCVTNNMVSAVDVACREGMRKPAPDTKAAVAQPLAAIERLPRRRALEVVACARAALAARCREVNAMTYPNPDEVWWCDLGEGVALAVIGIARERRIPLETNTGYLVLANGVPIGYGGVTPLFRQANTGINIFDSFRGSEAAYLWTQMLRAFHTLYGSTRFVINPYQFGAGNAEAIRSGAFWFYYRLGFRPAAAATRSLAAREARRMAGDRAYRSDVRTLRALASGDLCLDLPGHDAQDDFDEALLSKAGARAARQLARVATLSRGGAQSYLASEVARELSLDDPAHWPAEERRGFESLAPIFAHLPGMTEWPRADREALAAMLRAKGLAQERTFALRAARAPRAFHALREALRADR